MENKRAPQETPLPPCLLLGSSRNSRTSQRSGGVSSGALKPEMFYRSATDIIGSCAQIPEGRGLRGGNPLCDLVVERIGETPTPYNARHFDPCDDNYEFDGPLKQLSFRFEKLCRACGVTKPVSDFYTINDCAAIGRNRYPSARCKPCHNERTAENQRVRRASQKLDKQNLPNCFPLSPGSRSAAGLVATAEVAWNPKGSRGAEVKTVGPASRKSFEVNR